MLFCIGLPNFVQIQAPIAKIWRHTHFSRWRPRPLNTTSCFNPIQFLSVAVSYLLMSLPSEGQIMSVNQLSSTYHGWYITTSGLDEQTSAVLEFYFRFRSRPFHRNRRVILAAEFRQNQNIHCGNMTSYRFLRWRPSAMLYLLWGNGGPPMKCLSWSELGPQIASSSD